MIPLEKSNAITVRFQFTSNGLAPAKYGKDVYRFSDYVLRVLLAKRGWEIIKKTKTYFYAIPPEKVTEPFIIISDIPKKNYVLKLAEDYYDKKESVIDQIGEWPLLYEHRMSRDLIEHSYDLKTMTPIERRIKQSPKSWLFIGGEIWNSSVSIIDDQYEYSDYTSYIWSSSNDSDDAEIPFYFEGKEYNLIETKYERNSIARKKCIEHWGVRCMICGFSFEDAYGKIGHEYIHVHHIVPISTIKEEYIIDPIKDLIPLCANCHAIIHSNNPPFFVDEIRDIIERQRKIMKGSKKS